MKAKSWLYLVGLLILLATATLQANAQAGTAVCTDNADHSATTCRIDQPIVDQRAENGYPYKNVVFRPRDLVTVTAGGCVQTGGVGATWKRYVNPSSPDSDHLYYGTITIPGVTPPGFPVQIMSLKQYAIPDGVVPPNNVLVLGYKDEPGAYGDNGYWGHDDGTEDQCKQGPGRDGGPAWVVIKIDHDRSGFLSNVPAPLDIVADMVDTNGLPLNPKWGWEANPASRKLPYSNGKQFSTDPEPDPSQVCDGFPYINFFSGGVRLGSPPCSTQVGPNSIDVPSGPNDWACKQWGPPPGHLHGHVNWWPATVSGVIAWAGHETGLRLTSETNSHEEHGDDDYCFYLYPHNNSLLTLVRPNFIEAEMDSEETVDHFGSQWWNSFHTAVDDSSGWFSGVNEFPWGDTQPSKMITWKEATITGLVNIDQEHDGHSELHPIYAMAIHLNTSVEHPRGDPSDDRWAIFARNWGNEGFCSQDQHYWDVSPLSIFIPEPVPASDYELLEPLDLYANNTVYAQHNKVPGGLVIRFDLGVPENRAMVDGSLRIRWVPLPQTPAEASRAPRPTTMFGGASQPQSTDQMIAAGRAARREEETPNLLTGLSQDQIATVLQQLKKPPALKNTFKIQARRVTPPAEPTPLSVARFAPPKVRAVYDTARAEKLQHHWQVLCTAHNNNIPGYPQACRHTATPPHPSPSPVVSPHPNQ